MKMKRVKRSWVKVADKRGIPVELRCKKCGHVGMGVICLAIDFLSKSLATQFMRMDCKPPVGGSKAKK